MGGRSSSSGGKSGYRIPAMPKLAGSEKQVSWANSIRDETLKLVQREMRQISPRKLSEAYYDPSKVTREMRENFKAKEASNKRKSEFYQKSVSSLANKKDAKSWIDAHLQAKRQGTSIASYILRRGAAIK